MDKKGIKLFNGNNKFFNLLKKFFVFWMFFAKRFLFELSLYSGSVDLLIYAFKKCVFRFVRFKYVFLFFSCRNNIYIFRVRKYIDALKKKIITQWVDFLIKYFAKVSKWVGLHFVDRKFKFFNFCFRKRNVKGFGNVELLRLLLVVRNARRKNCFSGNLGVWFNRVREFGFFRYYGLNIFGFKKYFKVSNSMVSAAGYKSYLHYFLKKKKFVDKVFSIFCSTKLTVKFFRKFLFKSVNIRNLRLYRFTIHRFLIKAFGLKMLYIYNLRNLFVKRDFNFFYNLNRDKNIFFAYRKRGYKKNYFSANIFYKFLASCGGFNEKKLLKRRISLAKKNFFFIRNTTARLVKKKVVKTFFFTNMFLRSARAKKSIKPGPGKLNRFRNIMFCLSLRKRFRVNRIFVGMYLRMRHIYMMAIGDRRMFYYRKSKSRSAYYKFKKYLARRNSYRFLFEKDVDFYRKVITYYKKFMDSQKYTVSRRKIIFRRKFVAKRKLNLRRTIKMVSKRKIRELLRRKMFLRRKMARIFDSEKKKLLLNLRKTKKLLKDFFVAHCKGTKVFLKKNLGKSCKKNVKIGNGFSMEKLNDNKKQLIKKNFYRLFGLRNALFVLHIRRILVNFRKLRIYVLWFKVCFSVKKSFNKLINRISLVFFRCSKLVINGVKKKFGLKPFSSVDYIYYKLKSCFFSLSAKVFILCIVNWKYYKYFDNVFIKLNRKVDKYKKRRVLYTERTIMRRTGKPRLLWSEKVRERNIEKKKRKKPEIFVFYKKTKTNLFWTAVDFFGNVLLWMSIGRAGFKGAALRTDLAAKTCGEVFAKKLKKYSSRASISLFVRFRIRKVIKESLRAFLRPNRIKFKRVYVQFIRSHNGLRRPSARRL